MTVEPVVSVVMPVRNGEAFVDEAVESIRRQTLVELELVVVDDGSQDRTPEIVRAHAAADPRVRLYERPARGLVATLNEGCALASADLIARMDADDVAEPMRLGKQIGVLAREPGTVLLGSAVTLVDETGSPITRVAYPEEPRGVLLERNCFAHPSVVFRRAALERAGGYRDLFPHAEDYDLWLRLAEVGRVRNLAESLLRYRLHGRQVTRLEIEQQVVSTLAAQEAARARRASGVEPPRSELEPDVSLVRRRMFAAHVDLAASRLDAGQVNDAAQILAGARDLCSAATAVGQLGYVVQVTRLALRRRRASQER